MLSSRSARLVCRWGGSWPGRGRRRQWPGAAKAVKIDGGAYPAAARRAGREGLVIVKAEVLETGRVGAVELQESSGCKDLDRAALRAAKDWQFEPALENGQRVKSWTTVRCRYVLKS